MVDGKSNQLPGSCFLLGHCDWGVLARYTNIHNQDSQLGIGSLVAVLFLVPSGTNPLNACSGNAVRIYHYNKVTNVFRNARVGLSLGSGRRYSFVRDLIFHYTVRFHWH